MAMRQGEELDAQFIVQLLPPTKLEILEFSSGPIIRRAKVHAGNSVGWVSLWDSHNDPGILLVKKEVSDDDVEILRVLPGRRQRIKRNQSHPEQHATEHAIKPELDIKVKLEIPDGINVKNETDSMLMKT